jgi:hypothetical protein
MPNYTLGIKLTGGTVDVRVAAAVLHETFEVRADSYEHPVPTDPARLTERDLTVVIHREEEAGEPNPDWRPVLLSGTGEIV